MADIKHITEPDAFGYQVRIRRRGKNKTRYFSKKLWGGPKKALQAAISWRDQMLVALRVTNRRFLVNSKLNKTTGLVGVTRGIKTGKNKDHLYLYYHVSWVNKGKASHKVFHVSRVEKVTPDLELHVFRTARLFRTCYEHAIDNGVEFFHEKFDGWRGARLYDDVNFVAVGGGI